MAPDRDELAWNAVAVLYARVEQRLAKAMQRQHGLGLSDYRALSHLAMADQGGMRVQDLAETVGLNESSVSRLADRLEAAGLTERCVCEDDRRGVYVFITDPGRVQLKAAAPTYRAELAAALDQAAADPAVADEVQALRSAGLPHQRDELQGLVYAFDGDLVTADDVEHPVIADLEAVVVAADEGVCRTWVIGERGDGGNDRVHALLIGHVPAGGDACGR